MINEGEVLTGGEGLHTLLVESWVLSQDSLYFRDRSKGGVIAIENISGLAGPQGIGDLYTQWIVCQAIV
jgi:hypothetical protein